LKPRAGRGLALAAVAFAAFSDLGCETVDLGAPPADVNACEPGQQWFVSEIWPQFLGADYNGKHCYDSNCHGLGSSTQMTLIDITAELAALPTPPPDPLPMDVLADYTQAAQQMNCSDPGDSTLLILPEGRQVHGGNTLIMADGPEAMLVVQWVNMP
jgi:hypothetical protein